MPARLGLCLATVLLAAFGAAAPAGAQAVKPPTNDDCLACHSDPDAKRESGTSIAVDAALFGQSTHGPLGCVDCHKDLAALQEYPHNATLAKVSCATCHDDVGAKYQDSIHSWAKDKAGLTDVAPSCADCHGTHGIRGTKDAASRVFRASIPATCGSCHKGVLEHYDQGVHAEARSAGKDKAPVCVDCHTTHTIQRTDSDASRLGVTAECGTCHSESMRTYRDTFHGQVTNLGFVQVATCADCHGAHDIFAKADARSTVSGAGRVKTCQKCHESANENFSMYDPHADRHNSTRSPALYRAGLFMDGLLLTVFSAFGIHTALWLARGIRERRRSKGEGTNAAAR